MFRPLFKEFKKGKFLIGNNDYYSLCGFQYSLNNRSSAIISHNNNTLYFLIEVIINNEIINNYDLYIIDENNIKVDFGSNVNAIINILFYRFNVKCDFTPEITPTVTPSITPSVTISTTSSTTPTPDITITPLVTPTVTPSTTPTITNEYYPLVMTITTSLDGDIYNFGDHMVPFIVYDNVCDFSNNILSYHQDITYANIISGEIQIYDNFGCGLNLFDDPYNCGFTTDINGDDGILISTNSIIPTSMNIGSPTIPGTFENVMVFDLFSQISDIENSQGFIMNLVVDTNLGIMNWKIGYSQCA